MFFCPLGAAVQSDTTSWTPGAYRSRQGPQLLNDARTSYWSVAPTTKAPAALLGEYAHESRLSFPAAATTKTLLATKSATAAFMTCEYAPPTDMLTIDRLVELGGCDACGVNDGDGDGDGEDTDVNVVFTKFSPLNRLYVLPTPEQSSTLTEIRLAAFATPNVVPPNVDATAVPCP